MTEILHSTCGTLCCVQMRRLHVHLVFHACRWHIPETVPLTENWSKQTWQSTFVCKFEIITIKYHVRYGSLLILRFRSRLGWFSRPMECYHISAPYACNSSSRATRISSSSFIPHVLHYCLNFRLLASFLS